MVRKIVFISLAVILLAYVIFAVFFLNPQAGKGVCTNVEIVIADSLERHFIDNKDVAIILKKAGITLYGKNMQDIDMELVEHKIMENKLIKNVECYKTSGGNLKIEIYQKIPILRIISNKGSYYIDNEGDVMPFIGNFFMYLPIATGYVEKDFAKTKLYEFALFLHNDKFWDSQIEQIYVAPNQDVQLTPRVGNHQIILGNLDDYQENLDKLKLFYEKGLSKVGWDRYSVINLKYKNQVVCTKR